LKCSHYFNILDARGAVSVSERMAFILRIRKMARQCAKLYVQKYHPEVLEKDEKK